MSGMENSGNPANSGNILRDYFDSLLVETRYVGSYPAGTEFELFGRTFQTPVMTAALSHLDERVYPGARMDRPGRQRPTALSSGWASAQTMKWRKRSRQAVT